MKEKKLAVIFPGIGYTADKPLLYYSRKIAALHGYDEKIMAYTGFPPKIKGDRARMEQSFQIALEQSLEMLKDVDFSEYEDVLFIGKSIGTIVAAKIASESSAKDKIRQILYTPLEDTFLFPIEKAIAFTGDDDPWVGREKSRIFGLCEERKIPCSLIPYANHSLESKDPFADMKELYRIMKETERFISDMATVFENKEKKQGEYTLEDYLALPDERRVELIDGVIYDMSAPTGYHQLIAGRLYTMLFQWINGKEGKCMPFMSPVDVQLDCDNKTIVQPDVLILCDKSKYTPERIVGAPDFVAEVLSKSTKRKDIFIKLNKYKNAGVREYWIIDPDRKTVMVWHFEKDDNIALYSFRDRIPVGIYDGELVIDFAEIDDMVTPWM